MAGDRRCGARGSGSSTVVLGKRFGCRRRRTARGHACSPRGTSRSERGLARTCASIIERTSVGSRTATAKSWDRWRVRVELRASGDRHGHSSNEGTPNRDASFPVDERMDTTVLASRSRFAGTRDATGSVRGVRSSTVHAVDNAAARGAPPGAVLDPRRNAWGVGASPKLDGRRQTRIDLGPWFRKEAWRRPRGLWLRKRRSRPAGSVGGGESPTLGNRTFCGCMDSKSVAEVGTKHLVNGRGRAPKGARSSGR